ncbi:hypothetical protein WT24_11875 [Burkholderia sp. MSMB1078WGS]|uniref:hypothetical protein n=1 Tax=Burkholderia sp. MSMB1078WGS TaxID=1637900 RepID=UPI0007594B75|nr:hypothetical protein [Burkholderia sp. MSMB1078WGS]KVT12750.1 hypothetical protein WT24_11875 [Burkholderia sp. MSMB1078WGS]
MNRVLTVLTNRPVDGLIDNHAGYARANGYAHAIADGMHVFGRRQAVLYKYQAIFHELVCTRDDRLLLVLDPFSVVYAAHALDDVARGYDAIVTSQAPHSDLPAASGMIFRNNLAIRERLRVLVLEIGKWAAHLAGYAEYEEAMLLARAFPVLPFENRLTNGHFAAAQTVWDDGLALDSLPEAMPLIAHNAPRWELREGEWAVTPDYDFRYVLALLDDARQIAGKTIPRAAERWNAARHGVRPASMHLNLGARIAFVTLNTSEIAGYGQIHEENFVRYCQRHGYAYHVYREIPNDLPGGIAANWAKAHLVRRHLEEHAFVFWVDADVLAVNQDLPVEDTIAGRDFIIGMDHTAWAMNSCMFGARNTSAIRALIDRICSGIESVVDRSSIYASGGDQQAIQDALRDFGMLDASYIVDAMTLAASPVYATPDSRFVHFPAQHNHYRAITMSIWNRWSWTR